MDRDEHVAKWNAEADALVRKIIADDAWPGNFGSAWTQHGRRIREQVGNDRLLCALLRRRLPPYEGGPVTLFRGENLGRWRAGALGFAWTPDVNVALMFARGLNAVAPGGILLRCTFEATSIISGPNDHSRRLGEHQFTVDPFSATAVEEIEEFPSA
jgi:hypothetical protein